ncbi:MAG: hypothetical protein H6821_16230 [Planctomycetaceae bacterium]|nr:hypothetical protein [Planctomycetales bacterium]MCB9875718.1 hypothetical protein [Planctomycetaceae bacterium]
MPERLIKAIGGFGIASMTSLYLSPIGQLYRELPRLRNAPPSATLGIASPEDSGFVATVAKHLLHVAIRPRRDRASG